MSGVSNLQLDSSPLNMTQAITLTKMVWEEITLPKTVVITDVFDLAVDSNNALKLYLGTKGSLFRSDNAGVTWTEVFSQPSLPVIDIIPAPSDNQRIYINTYNYRRSDDSGRTWRIIATPPNGCDLIVAPTNPDRLYVRNCLYDKLPVLYRSDDGGASWISPTLNFTTSLYQVIVHPKDPDLLVANGYGSFVYRSSDGGQNWKLAATGTSYGMLVVDPNPPNWLYIGSSTGVMRSSDFGSTWQDAPSGYGLFEPIISPFSKNSLLGRGNNLKLWIFQNFPDDWKLSSMASPAPLTSVYRSYSDNKAFYVRTDHQIWRYIGHQTTSLAVIFLPFVKKNAEGAAVPATTLQAIERANYYRGILGILPLRAHSAIVSAAQNHANYVDINFDDQSAWEFGPHGEVEGKPGYSGKWPYDRIRNAGFPYSGGSEVMHWIGDPTASVDGWMSTVYHRVLTIDPGAHYTGYGIVRKDNRGIDVFDFGSGPVDSGMWFNEHYYPLAYPTYGQTGVPAEWDGGETPDPLPPGADRPVGFPFTLQGAGGKLQVASAEMLDQDGNLVPVHPNPPDCPAFNCYALIPVHPLEKSTSYTVHAAGDVDGFTFNRTWNFTTSSSGK